MLTEILSWAEDIPSLWKACTNCTVWQVSNPVPSMFSHHTNRCRIWSANRSTTTTSTTLSKAKGPSATGPAFYGGTFVSPSHQHSTPVVSVESSGAYPPSSSLPRHCPPAPDVHRGHGRVRIRLGQPKRPAPLCGFQHPACVQELRCDPRLGGTESDAGGSAQGFLGDARRGRPRLGEGSVRSIVASIQVFAFILESRGGVGGAGRAISFRYSDVSDLQSKN